MKVPIRFTRRTVLERHPAGVARASRARPAHPMPAQHTLMRSPPSACAAGRPRPGPAPRRSRRRRRTRPAGRARGPAPPLPRSGRRSSPRHRRACSARAVASPSPEAPPTTIAPLPSVRTARKPLRRREGIRCAVLKEGDEFPDLRVESPRATWPVGALAQRAPGGGFHAPLRVTVLPRAPRPVG